MNPAFLSLKTVKVLLSLWPFHRGKQTFAHHLFRTLFRKLQSPIRTLVRGIHFELDLADRMQGIFFLTGLYEPKTIAAILSSLPPDEKSVYLDVGANVGLLSLQVRKARPLVQCHLFEPDPQTFQKLKKNVSLNPFRDIHLHQLIVSDQTAQQQAFHTSPMSSESGWGRLATHIGGNTAEANLLRLPSITIDDHCAQARIEQIDLLKVDVEGAEALVLRGASRYLSEGKIKAVICEMNDGALQAFGMTSEKIKGLLASHGFTEVARFEMNALFKLKR
jgi:FkbM family methyltransferase